MIIISGLGRSGTSMWMHTLRHSTLNIIGERFPQDWEEKLKAMNPVGYYESTLMGGVNFTTNYDASSKQKVIAKEHQDTGVKIFLMGVRKTPKKYLNKVLVTFRHWRAFEKSIEKFRKFQAPVIEQKGETNLHPVLWWFLEHYCIIEDALQRGYSIKFAAYEQITASPDKVLSILHWMKPDISLTKEPSELILSKLHHNQDDSIRPDFPEHWIQAFDDLYEYLQKDPVLSYSDLHRFKQVFQEIVHKHRDLR